jgi:hypothetical protein
MSQLHRAALSGLILSIGLAAQAGLERLNRTERPPLRQPLASMPMNLGTWSGRNDMVDPEILVRADSTEYVNRIYESRNHPGLSVRLWINYSREGWNLLHTPEICLPSGGWTKIESQSREMAIPAGGDRSTLVMHLAYSQAELVEHVGFWYYIFGEGKLENYVRQLPITSRSSHGQTTRGSSMTVEVFYTGDNDSEGNALREFAGDLLKALEPILPKERAEYHVP